MDDVLEYWRLNEDLSVRQAALLIVEGDPDDPADDPLYPPPQGFSAVVGALKSAVTNQRLPARIRREARLRGYDERANCWEEPGNDEHIASVEKVYHDHPADESAARRILGSELIWHRGINWDLTTVHVDDLRTWLSASKLRPSFFFPAVPVLADTLTASPRPSHCSPEANVDRPIQPRQRRSLLTMLSAVCKHFGFDTDERGAAQRIREMTEELGAPVDDDTIRNLLREIPDAVETRKRDS